MYLRGDVRVMFTVTIAIVRVDVISSEDSFRVLQYDSRMIVRDNIRVSVLALIYIHTRMIPRKLLTRFDRLKRKTLYNYTLTRARVTT